MSQREEPWLPAIECVDCGVGHGLCVKASKSFNASGEVKRLDQPTCRVYICLQVEFWPCHSGFSRHFARFEISEAKQYKVRDFNTDGIHAFDELITQTKYQENHRQHRAQRSPRQERYYI